jgi:hypothetical protein
VNGCEKNPNHVEPEIELLPRQRLLLLLRQEVLQLQKLPVLLLPVLADEIRVRLLEQI